MFRVVIFIILSQMGSKLGVGGEVLGKTFYGFSSKLLKCLWSFSDYIIHEHPFLFHNIFYGNFLHFVVNEYFVSQKIPKNKLPFSIIQ